MAWGRVHQQDALAGIGQAGRKVVGGSAFGNAAFLVKSLFLVAHNPKVVGSNPAPATKSSARSHRWLRAFYFLEQAGFTLDVRDRSHTLCEMSGRVRGWLVLGNSSILLHRSTMTALDAVFEAAFFGKEPFKAGLLSH